MAKRKKPHVVNVRLPTPLYDATEKYRKDRKFSQLVCSLLSNHLEGDEAEIEQLRSQIEQRRETLDEVKSEMAALEAQLEDRLSELEEERRQENMEQTVREELTDHRDHLLENGTPLRESKFWAVAEGQGFVDELGEDLCGEIIDDVLAEEVTH